MGKPFASELGLLQYTYSWSLAADIDALVAAVADFSKLPLLAVGSGGAYSTAYFVSQLHERAFRQLSKPVTPLAFVEAQTARGKAALILSAGGENPDAVGALRSAVLQEAGRILVVCLRPGSKLSKLARRYSHVDIIEYEPPAGRDGFLATNSLIAFNTLFLRAYLRAEKSTEKLPRSFNRLLGTTTNIDSFAAKLTNRSGPLWKARTLLILHGSAAASAAVDLESKFTEAALIATQLADYRNFAHGRHHWLAKRGSSSAVLALVTKDDVELAEKTAKQLPEEICFLDVATKLSGLIGGLALTSVGLYLIAAAGEAEGIDPGRPGVPAFGSRIYRLNAFGRKPLIPQTTRPTVEEVSICRKANATIEHLSRNGDLRGWRVAYRAFIRRLEKQRFGGMVFDYDGTLCSERDRFTGINSGIAAQLSRLLKSGISIGIATGRGRSVRKDLQEKIPRLYWEKILIAYYNGSEISIANDGSKPDVDSTVSGEIALIADLIAGDPTLTRNSEITYRKNQITIVPRDGAKADVLWALLQAKVQPAACRLVRSSHSFDIIPSFVSKLNLVRTITDRIGGSAILCVGDRGVFPGNDFELLAQPFSLSVDEVSFDPDTCWNIAPPGVRGVDATLYYLRSLITAKSRAQFRSPNSYHET